MKNLIDWLFNVGNSPENAAALAAIIGSVATCIYKITVDTKRTINFVEFALVSAIILALAWNVWQPDNLVVMVVSMAFLLAVCLGSMKLVTVFNKLQGGSANQ